MNRVKLVILSLLLVSMSVFAEGLPTPENAWLRAAPPNANMLAAYVQLNNETKEPVTLVGAQSDLFHMTEIHRTVEVEGVYKMRQQKAIEIVAGETLIMEPGGLHIMLMMPQESLTLGQKVEIILLYETTSGDQVEQAIPFEVKKAR